MACFIVPATEAALVSVVHLVLERRSEKKSQPAPAACRHLSSLAKLLWGGSALLAFEHLWHGEIQPSYPFLTAGMGEVLHEMATVGVSMALLVTFAWAVVSYAKHKMQAPAAAPKTEAQ